jgi:predicted Holliday junction resolvase-like endonuclease
MTEELAVQLLWGVVATLMAVVVILLLSISTLKNRISELQCRVKDRDRWLEDEIERHKRTRKRYYKLLGGIQNAIKTVASKESNKQ